MNKRVLTTHFAKRAWTIALSAIIIVAAVVPSVAQAESYMGGVKFDRATSASIEAESKSDIALLSSEQDPLPQENNDADESGADAPDGADVADTPPPDAPAPRQAASPAVLSS